MFSFVKIVLHLKYFCSSVQCKASVYRCRHMGQKLCTQFRTARKERWNDKKKKNAAQALISQLLDVSIS